jgi:hypothetical protein
MRVAGSHGPRRRGAVVRAGRPCGEQGGLRPGARGARLSGARRPCAGIAARPQQCRPRRHKGGRSPPQGGRSGAAVLDCRREPGRVEPARQSGGLWQIAEARTSPERCRAGLWCVLARRRRGYHARHGGGAVKPGCRVPLVLYFSVTSGTNI